MNDEHRNFAAMFLLLAMGAFVSHSSSADSTKSEATTSSSARGADAEYRLGPEDVVEVFVWKEPELSSTSTVRPDGRITLPLAGEIDALGKTPSELQVEIADRLDEYVASPVVTVIVKEINSPQISVLGEVRRPGRYRIAQSATILDAIALGGGFTDYARRSRVVVLRSGAAGVERIPVDVKRLLRNGQKPLALQPGDTVYVD